MACEHGLGAVMAGDFPGCPDAQAGTLIGHVHRAGAAAASHDAEADFQCGFQLRVGHAGIDLPGIPGRHPVLVGHRAGASFNSCSNLPLAVDVRIMVFPFVEGRHNGASTRRAHGRETAKRARAFLSREEGSGREKTLERDPPARSFPVIEVHGGHGRNLETLDAASRTSGLYTSRCDAIPEP